MAHVHTFGTVAPAAAGIIQFALPSILPELLQTKHFLASEQHHAT